MASAILSLSSCSLTAQGGDACENPEILRIQVGDTLFDLTNSVDTPSSSSLGEGEKGRRKSGIVEPHIPGPRNRLACNLKGHPIANLGPDVNFLYLGDGSEPPRYRWRGHMHAMVWIYNYDALVARGSNHDYLTDVEQIKHVRFIKRTELPRNGASTFKKTAFEFSAGDRKVRMECLTDFYARSKSENDTIVPPSTCFPNATFRAGNLLISTDQLPMEWKTKHLIPPEEWPEQWAYTINKVSSFRVPRQGS